MTDLDQFALKEIAWAGLAPVFHDEHGVDHVLVPLALLQRVTREFDVDHVRAELRGPRFRQ